MVNTPKRRLCRMVQKLGVGTFVIPDANGTVTLVTIACQSNHMKWNASMIWAGSIGFLGVSSMIFGAIARSLGTIPPGASCSGGAPAPCARPPSQKTSVTGERTPSPTPVSSAPVSPGGRRFVHRQPPPRVGQVKVLQHGVKRLRLHCGHHQDLGQGDPALQVARIRGVVLALHERVFGGGEADGQNGRRRAFRVYAGLIEILQRDPFPPPSVSRRVQRTPVGGR